MSEGDRDQIGEQLFAIKGTLEIVLLEVRQGILRLNLNEGDRLLYEKKLVEIQGTVADLNKSVIRLRLEVDALRSSVRGQIEP